MKQFKGVIDRFEGKTAVILVENLDGFGEGDTVSVTIKKQNTNQGKKTKNLLGKILKEE